MSSQALYRFYDADGVLLYVGISKHWPERLTQHRRDKVWWTEVARIDLEPFPTREAVLEAERAAIIAERPRYNVIHNGGGSSPTATPQPAPDALRKGQFVALGLRDGRCPVGEIVAVGDMVRLRLKDWMSGYYSGADAAYWLTDVAEVQFGHQDCHGYVEDENLCDFQMHWHATYGADRSRIGTPS